MSDPTPQIPPPVMNYASPGIAPPKQRSLLGWVLFIGLAIMLFFVLNSKQRAAAPMISLSEFTEQLAKGNVAEVLIADDTIRGSFARPVQFSNPSPGVTRFQTEMPQGTTQSWGFIQWLLEHREGANVSVDNHQNLLLNILLPLVPWVLIFGFIWYFVFRQLRKAGGQPKAIPVYITTPESK